MKNNEVVHTRITKVSRKVDEVDKRHTENHSALKDLINKLDYTFPQLVEGNKNITNELVKMNENLTNQDRRILKIEYDIEDLAEDTEEFKNYLSVEREKAEIRGKETRDWILKVVAVLVGGGGISWLLSPLFEILKKMIGGS